VGISSSQQTLTPSFFRGVGLNHQPAIVCLVNQINRTILMTASPVDWNTSQGKGRLLSNWSMDSIATQSGRAWNILPINTETTWSTGLLSRSRSGDAACVVFRKIYSTLQTCRTCEDAKETRRRKVYPLVICHITMERSTIFHGKIHELSMVIFQFVMWQITGGYLLKYGPLGHWTALYSPGFKRTFSDFKKEANQLQQCRIVTSQQAYHQWLMQCGSFQF
jgi:hypothetical protein